ncbi:MAG: hypothetical protein KatS3mg112_1493 [Thermogutta sp.]|nr:MAG: hypothetical protein KatS3mg112_1493 [Thermogutta sp.]
MRTAKHFFLASVCCVVLAVNSPAQVLRNLVPREKGQPVLQHEPTPAVPQRSPKKLPFPLPQGVKPGATTEERNTEQPGPGSARVLREIEERNVRGGMVTARPTRVIIVNDGNQVAAQASQQIEEMLRPAIEELNRGGKMTKADAARKLNGDSQLPRGLRGPQGVQEEDTHKLAQMLAEWLNKYPARTLGIVVTVPTEKTKPPACPPPGCGCKQEPGISMSCDCSLWQGWCYCLFCMYYPLPDPAFRNHDGSEPSGPRNVDLIVIVRTPETPSAVLQHLWNSGQQELRTINPTASSLVIKTKSCPP